MIEGLVASMVMSVAVVAMFGSWSTCYQQSKSVAEVTGAAEIARAQLEISKMWGAGNVVTGTYNSTTSTGTWTGAYVQGTGWVTGGTAYFDVNGAPVASATATGAYFSSVLSATDANVLQGTGTTYTIQSTSPGRSL